jgi:hypothetical protein
LLDLIDQAVAGGWEHRRACRYLELDEGRAWRWRRRRDATPADEHNGRGPRIRAARKRGLRHARWARIIYHRPEKLKANRRSPTDVD